jgi:hypothetical protein
MPSTAGKPVTSCSKETAEMPTTLMVTPGTSAMEATAVTQAKTVKPATARREANSSRDNMNITASTAVT